MGGNVLVPSKVSYSRKRQCVLTHKPSATADRNDLGPHGVIFETAQTPGRAHGPLLGPPPLGAGPRRAGGRVRADPCTRARVLGRGLG